MSTQTALIITAALVAGVYAYKQYQAAKEKERAAKQWNTVLDLGTAIVGIL